MRLRSGLGAGGDPEMGKKAAIESIDELINLLGVNTKNGVYYRRYGW